MINIELTKNEANHVLVAVIAREDLLDNEIKKAGECGNSQRVLEIAKTKSVLKETENKLVKAGATLPYLF